MNVIISLKRLNSSLFPMKSILDSTSSLFIRSCLFPKNSLAWEKDLSMLSELVGADYMMNATLDRKGSSALFSFQ